MRIKSNTITQLNWQTLGENQVFLKYIFYLSKFWFLYKHFNDNGRKRHINTNYVSSRELQQAQRMVQQAVSGKG